MKRIAFLIVAFSFTTSGLFQSSVSLGQDFPNTNQPAFDAPIIIPEAETFPLPPLPSVTSGAAVFESTGMQSFGGEQAFSSPSEIQMFSAAYDQSQQQPMQSVGEPVFEEGVPQGVVSEYQAAGCADGSCTDCFADESQIVGEYIEPNRRKLPRPVFDRPLPEKLNYGVYSTISVSALLFNRNNGPSRNFSTNGGGELLSSDDAVSDVLGGIDVGYARRHINGLGIEARYFGLYPSDVSAQIGNASSLFPGLSQIAANTTGTGPATIPIAPSALGLFNATDTHVLTRQTDMNNFEINILQNSRPRFHANSTELLLGFRYFQFGETLLYEAVDIPQLSPIVASPESIGYFSSVENQLLGIQIGGRSDYQLRHHIGLHLGLKAGIFSNDVSTRQRIDYRLRDGGVTSPVAAGGPRSGQPFDIGGEDNSKSLMGELDVALSLQFSARSRVRVGYRALGVTDIAFASSQYQDDFTDATGFQNPSTNENLILQGSYIGWEMAY